MHIGVGERSLLVLPRAPHYADIHAQRQAPGAVTGTVLRVDSGTPRQQQSQLQHQPHHEPATTTMERRGDGSERVAVTQENLPKMKNVVILQNEGIIYCPIAKVN